MIDLRPTAFVAGLFLLGLALFMILPALASVAYGEPDWDAFLISAAITALTGAALSITGRMDAFHLSPRGAFLLTTVTWLAVSLFAALPLVIIEHIDYSDAFFETMSGITTTGSTVLVGLEKHSRGILLWRSILQWIGGIGFIAMAVGILPFLRVGGMRLFRSESSDWSEKVTPRFGSFVRAITWIYLYLSALACFCFWLAGMDVFDAINHAMTTISTGGYSSYDSSIGHFNAPGVEWVAIVFMIVASMPFALYVHVVQGRPDRLWADRQVRGFLRFLVFVSLTLALWLWITGKGDLLDVITAASFNVVSIVTTTGYASEDYGQWGTLATVVFFYLMFVGGCSGSTSGAVKIFRFQVAYMALRGQLFRLVHPSVTVAERYNNREITDDIMRSLVAFSFFFGLTVGGVALVLSAFGLDLVTSVTGAVTAVSNVGPGLGPIIGPSGNFASIPDPAKWVLSIGMLLGRLEIMTVLVLFTPGFWRG